MRKILNLSLLLSIFFQMGWSDESERNSNIISRIKPQKIERIAVFNHPDISESSGIIPSRLWPNVLWTHNDSGDPARIFAIDLEGNPIFPSFLDEDTYNGLRIGNAVNVDWEDIATDENGNLYIAACGNNANMRRDLAIYKLPEPDPRTAILTRYSEIYPFSWPDQKRFPPEERNFDCEAIFWANGTLYLLSKHRSDTMTKLYKFDTLEHDVQSTPSLIDSFEIMGQVTAADATRDSRKIAVLTYDNIWVFERNIEDEDGWIRGKKYFFKTIRENIKQCEAIAFKDSETLLITNEQGEIFELNLSRFEEIY
jgi:hypothetical protein